jgi:hypothetical protein
MHATGRSSDNVGVKKQSSVDRVTRDRCYDFLNIFAKIFGENIGIFDLKQS